MLSDLPFLKYNLNITPFLDLIIKTNHKMGSELQQIVAYYLYKRLFLYDKLCCILNEYVLCT